MITRLVIHRFRGIREGVLDDLGKVNLLIGPNNSGKTAILELLYLGGTSGRPVQLILDDVPVEDGESLTFQATASARFDVLGLEPLPRLRKRHGYRKRWAEAPVTLTEEGGLEVNLGSVVRESALGSFRLAAPLPEWGLHDKTQFYEKDIGVVALFSLDKQSGIPKALTPSLFDKREVKSESSRWHFLWDPAWVYRGNRQRAIDYLAVWAEEGHYPASDRVLFFDFHTANAHFTINFARWAKGQRWDWAEKVGEHLGRVFPELAGAKVEIDDVPDNQTGKAGYIRRRGEVPILIDQFGDGARHAFKVLAGLVALCETVDEEHPGLFLWEDPELFMHPATLGRLLSEMMKLVRDKPLQIFMTTQSLEVIVWFARYLDEADDQEADKMRSYRLALKQGLLEIHKFEGRGISGWLHFFGDPRFIGEDEAFSPLFYLFRGGSE